MRTFFAGVASICAASVTHPIDTIKIRLQVQGAGGAAGGKQYNNIFRGAMMVVEHEGVRGLYKGIRLI